MRSLAHRSPPVRLVIVLLALGLVTPPVLPARAAAAPPEKDHEHAPDPCQQALKAQGKAEGLHRRCEVDGTGAGVSRGDFNGDGIADLAIGVPYEDLDGINAAGVVPVIYGTTTGLQSTGNQLLDERTFRYSLHSNDHFGWALASGDFDGDGFSDLAIGMPDVELGGTDDGIVFLINGSASGLSTNTGKSLGPLNGTSGRMGAALVWGDFNGDDIGDLAVGIPDATVTGDGFACSRFAFPSSNAGEVQVFYGSSRGLGTFGAQVLRQGACDFGSDGEGVGDSVEENDHFGITLSALRSPDGDSLVIGVPFEDLGLFDKIDAGIVHVVPGFSNGLDSTLTQTLSQDTPGVGGASESGDQFGRVLAGGDFNGNGTPDLAVGVPFEDLSGNAADDAGAVIVFSDFGLYNFGSSSFISQADLPGVSIETGDRFGWALAAGDFNGDGSDDLAVGSPGEDVGSIVDAGIVNVLYGRSGSGLSFTTAQLWHQDSSGIADVAEPGDQFGYSLSAWNFGKTSAKDLAIGVPFEDLTSTSTGTLMQDAGAVHVLYGGSTGLTSTGSQFWTQDSAGILDSSQTGDRFGITLY